ncbi:hypothetical protein OIU74_018396 [Salix koriyanagi]|uniref:Uncharacterized protein n=1 Tax=Salix koriyanagi TaxID=2511006 RepID=A0A9Q1AI94_9ROSI|nr:hypothetical protein OIU74_018396 [Salix koriyanagi]
MMLCCLVEASNSIDKDEKQWGRGGRRSFSYGPNIQASNVAQVGLNKRSGKYSYDPGPVTNKNQTSYIKLKMPDGSRNVLSSLGNKDDKQRVIKYSVIAGRRIVLSAQLLQSDCCDLIGTIACQVSFVVYWIP